MSQLASTFSSLLMALPLIAVPALAILGLPASDDPPAAEDDLGIELGELGVPSTLGQESAHAHEHGHEHEHSESKDSPFGPLQDAAEQVRANSSDRAHFAPTSGFHGAAANAGVGLNAEAANHEHQDNCCDHADSEQHAHHEHHEEPTAMPSNGENPFLVENSKTSHLSTLNSKLSAQPSTLNPQPKAWTTVLSELRTLGIKNFRLTNGDVPGKFFFCCSLRTSQNILQRFEAEATTPVAAARDVIAQVESWQSTR